MNKQDEKPMWLFSYRKRYHSCWACEILDNDKSEKPVVFVEDHTETGYCEKHVLMAVEFMKKQTEAEE